MSHSQHLVRRVVILAATCLITFAAFSRAAAQDAPSQELLIKLIQYLSSQLGIPVTTIDSYTYEAADFSDTSLGCPLAGENYAQVIVPGWKVKLTIAAITYDMRTSRSGDRIVICAAISAGATATPTLSGEIVITATFPTSPTIEDTFTPTLPPTPTMIPLALFRATQYTIAYPNEWRVTDRGGGEVYFGASPTPVCAGAGMFAAFLGAAGENTPSTLLDDYTPAVTRAEFTAGRTPVRRSGLSAFYIAPCADGTIRQFRVTMFVAYGNAYRVIQFAPQTDYPLWTNAFAEMLNRFGPTTVAAGVIDAPRLPPATSPLALLAHIFGGNVYVGTLVDLPGKPISGGATTANPYREVTVSPRGDALAYIDPNARTLILASPTFGAARVVAGELVTSVGYGYPPAWSPDGREIAFVVGNILQASSWTIRALNIETGTVREIGSAGAVKTSCSAPSPDPAARLMAAEAGYPITGAARPLLAWAKTGYIYISGNCGRGVMSLPAAGGVPEQIAELVYLPALSPNGETLLGAVNSPAPALVAITVADKTVKTLLNVPEGKTITALAWDTNPAYVYVAWSTLREELPANEPTEQARGMAYFGTWDFRVGLYDVQLFQLDLVKSAAKELYAGRGYGIGRIAPSPDGTGILFTLTESAAPLIDAFLNNVAATELLRQAPATQVWWLPLLRGVVGEGQMVAETSGIVWGGNGSAPAPTPTGGASLGGGTNLTRTPSATASPPPTWTPFQTPGATATPPPTSPFGSAPPTNTPRSRTP
ncbi:MAG: PD40 domain-containing protein [Anaerolineales bacterium]|nr:PD40 domain-containing protein [Anaerolineales bacterium]